MKSFLCYLIALFLAIACIDNASFSYAESAPKPTSAPAKPGFLEEKHDNGQLKARYAIDAKGVKSGMYTLFTDDAKRIERGVYKNGQLDGSRQTFYPNGNPKLSESYRNGKLDGSITEYDEKGSGVRAAQYANGVAITDRTLVEGLMIYPRSIEIVTAELEKIRKQKIETLKETTPVPAHEGANDSQEDRENAVRRLMEYRYLSYVPHTGIVLDPMYNAHDEAAAAILSKIGKLDHTPANPGWPDDRYKFAYKGTSSSNIFQSSGRESMNVSSVNAYMDDSDQSNIDRVGHRRWCLNPALGKVGFGSFKGFSAMWSMDHSRKDIPPYDFVACPGPGYYPTTHFGNKHAWSISVSEAKYAKPAKGAVKASITPVEIQLSKNKISASGKAFDLDYENLELGGFGISNCIIFRPAAFKMEEGKAYLVDVVGLKGTNGRPAPLRYVVQFFKPESAKMTE